MSETIHIDGERIQNPITVNFFTAMSEAQTFHIPWCFFEQPYQEFEPQKTTLPLCSVTFKNTNFISPVHAKDVNKNIGPKQLWNISCLS